jgi:hypothetical protein
MPEHIVKLMQEQGLKNAVATLQQQQQGGGWPLQDTAAAAAVQAAGGGAVSELLFDAATSPGSGEVLRKAGIEGVAVAVEVDGPTHVAMNRASHALGATVSRNWLLQQWGWTVVLVPWWEWQELDDVR